MQSTISQKESVDKLRSPEQLNEYICVSRPSVWILLASAVFLLMGLLVWSIFGTVETTVRTGARIENGIAVCYVNEEDAAIIKPGMPVVIREQTGSIRAVSAEPVTVDEVSLHPYLAEAAQLTAGSFCYAVEADLFELEDGIYFADITVESIHPIRFVIK